MTSGVRMLPINVNQRYMLVSQETSGYNKDDHRDIKNSFISFQEVLSYIMHVVFLSIEGISSLPAGITLITMSRPQVKSSCCHRSLSSIILCPSSACPSQCFFHQLKKFRREEVVLCRLNTARRAGTKPIILIEFIC